MTLVVERYYFPHHIVCQIILTLVFPLIILTLNIRWRFFSFTFCRLTPMIGNPLGPIRIRRNLARSKRIVDHHPLFFPWYNGHQCARTSSLSRFHDHTQTRHTRWESSGRVFGWTQRPLPCNTQHLQQINIRASSTIRTCSISRQAAADLHLRPCNHWD